MIKIRSPKTILIVAALLFSLLPMQRSVYALGSINVSKTNISLSEDTGSSNYSDTFQLQLIPEPTSPITLIYSTNQECTLGYEGAGFTVSGQLVSSAEFYQFTVRAVDDNVKDGSHNCVINYSTSSVSDTEYQGVSLVQTVAIADNGDNPTAPQFYVQKITGGDLGEGSSNIEEYSISISEAPQDPITIYANAGPQCQMLQNDVRVDTASGIIAAGSTKSLSFTVIGRQDEVFEGAQTCVIAHSISTNDSIFTGIVPASYYVVVSDDDPTFLQEQAEAERKEFEEKLAKQDAGLLDFYDSNNDGILDNDQNTVTSFINSNTGHRQALITYEDCLLSGAIESLTGVGYSLDFPLGVYKFKLNCSSQDSDTKVQLLLDQDYSKTYGWLLRKINEEGEVSLLRGSKIGTESVQNGTVTSVMFDVSPGSDFELLGFGLPFAPSAIEDVSDIQTATTKPIYLWVGLSLAGLFVAVFGASRLSLPAKLRVTKKVKPEIDRF